MFAPSLINLAVFAFVAICSANANCPDGYTEESGQCYKLYTTPKTYENAQAQCQSDGGGNLASVHTRAEHIFLRELVYASNPTNQERAFIGYSDYYSGWIDRTPMDYLSFTVNNKGKQCQAVWGKTKHNRSPIRFSRVRCDVAKPYICKTTAGACKGRVIQAIGADQIGTTLTDVADLTACDNLCKGDGSCTYFTYNVASQKCNLYSGTFSAATPYDEWTTFSGEPDCSANMLTSEKALCPYTDTAKWVFDDCEDSSMGATCGLHRVKPLLGCFYCGDSLDPSNCPSPIPSYTACPDTPYKLPNFGMRGQMELFCDGACAGVTFEFKTVDTSDASYFGIHESQPASNNMCGADDVCLAEKDFWQEDVVVSGSLDSSQDKLYVGVDDYDIVGPGVNTANVEEWWSMPTALGGNAYAIQCYEGDFVNV